MIFSGFFLDAAKTDAGPLSHGAVVNQENRP